MTIKSKLILNLIVTSTIIVVLGMGGYRSLRFIQDKFLYITQKSAPYQVRTVEFERALQDCITDLIKVNGAHTIDEYNRFRGGAEHSLVAIKQAQETLEKIKPDSERLNVVDDFKRIAAELFEATKIRLENEKGASEANATISGLLNESSQTLKELELRIRSLQSSRAAAFVKALENTNQYSVRLRGIEDLRNLVKELQAAAATTYETKTKSSFLIARGRINSILGRISQNRYSVFFESDVQSLTADAKEFIELQAVAVAGRDTEARLFAQISWRELSELNNSLQLTLNQEIELLAARLDGEIRMEELIFNESSRANAILLTNSELVGQALTISGEINRLFTLETLQELEKKGNDIRTRFDRLNELAAGEEQALKNIAATGELNMLFTAQRSLKAIREEMFSVTGVLPTLTRKLTSGMAAEKAAERLNVLVDRQGMVGKEAIATASLDQETTITTVNAIIQENISRIAFSGGIAIVLGMIIGFWISRSVLNPMNLIMNAVRNQTVQAKEKAALAEAVAGGEFDREVAVGTSLVLDSQRRDEFGTVLNELVGMSEAQVTLDRAFRDMTQALRLSRDQEQRRDRIKTGLYELNIILRVDLPTKIVADQALSFLMKYLGAGTGILYGCDESDELLYPLACYAVSPSCRTQEGFRLGEGIVGEVALQRKMRVLDSVPPGYLTIGSAVGNNDPLMLVAIPLLHNDSLAGVLEFGSFHEISDDEFIFLHQALEGISIALLAGRSRNLVADLLEQTQMQAEELRTQQEELQQTNEELLERTQVLETMKRMVRNTV